MDEDTRRLIEQAISTVKRAVLVYVIFWLIPALCVTGTVIYFLVTGFTLSFK